MINQIELEAYETVRDDFTALIVYYQNGYIVSNEKIEGFDDQQDAFIAGFNKIFEDRELSEWNQATFTSNQFKRHFEINF